MSNLTELLEECERVVEVNQKAEAAIKKAELLKNLGFANLHKQILEKAQVEAKINRLAPYKYIKIGQENILKFLKKKAAFYNSLQAKPQKLVKPGMLSPRQMFTYNAIQAIQGDDSLPVSQAHDNTAVEAASIYQNVSYTWVNATSAGVYQDPVGQTQKYGEASFSVATVHAMSNNSQHIGRYTWTEKRVEDYNAIPPDQALDALVEAKNREVFDYFTIASVNAVHDPLLLGRIIGSKDRYFLAQWGDDVALDDVI